MDGGGLLLFGEPAAGLAGGAGGQQPRGRRGAETPGDPWGPGSFCEDGGDLLLFSKPAADPAERSAAGKAEQGRDG